MPKLRSLLSLFLCAFLSVSMLVPTRQAKAVDAATAGMAKMIGGVLIIHGVYSLYKDVTKLNTGNGMIAKGTPLAASVIPPTAAAGAAMVAEGTALTTAAKAKIPIDLLEIAGGAAAMMMNAKSESDLKDTEGYMPDGAPPGGAPGGGTTAGGPGEIADTCALMPTLCQKTPEGKPVLRLPPKEEMKAAITQGFNGQPVNPDGLSLEDALNDLDDKYNQAEGAIAAFNAASQSGAFDEGGPSLADTGQTDNDGGEGEGLNTGRGVAGGTSGGLESFTLPNGQSTDWASLLGKKKAERGPLAGAKAVGMNLEDGRTGRLLTLFERATRTLRGTRDRDILLAKVEWTRKEAARKQNKKHPNIAVSTEKN